MANAQDNPFFKPWNTPHGTAPFTEIKDEHYKPAVQHGIELANKEINAITSNPAAPDFKNTIVALEKTGADLDRVLGVYFALLSADAYKATL